MNRIIYYYTSNISMLALMYFGLIQNHIGALNLALFLTWFCSLASLFLFSYSVMDDLIKKQPTNVCPNWVALLFSFISTAAWAWHAHWFTATVTVFAWLATSRLQAKRNQISR